MPILQLEQQPEGYSGLPLFNARVSDRGACAGDVIALDAAEVVVGRDAAWLRQAHPGAALLFLPYAPISRGHARFARTDAGYVVEDLRSRLGTYVNGQPITRQVLHDGDRIRITDFEFVYQTAGPA